MTNKRMRALVPVLSGALFTLIACSVQDLKFAPDSEFQDADNGGAGDASSSGGSSSKAGSGSKAGSSTGGTSNGGQNNGGTSAGGISTGGTGGASAGNNMGGSAPMAGMAGMPGGMCPSVRAVKDQPLIDDFEDGNAGLPMMPMMGGRAGGWWIVTDPDSPMATIMPPADPTRPPNPDKPGYNMTAYAMHMKGSGFRGWGATVGATLLSIPDRTTPCPYDVSAFAGGGIRFYLKGTTGDGIVRFGLQTQETSTIADGGFCDPFKQKCYDVFSYEITVPPMWTLVSVPFAKLQQLNGQMMDKNLAHVLAIEFAVHGAANTQTGTCVDQLCSFDLWIDQVEFF